MKHRNIRYSEFANRFGNHGFRGTPADDKRLVVLRSREGRRYGFFGERGMFLLALLDHTDTHIHGFGDVARLIMFIAVGTDKTLAVPGNTTRRDARFGECKPLV